MPGGWQSPREDRAVDRTRPAPAQLGRTRMRPMKGSALCGLSLSAVASRIAECASRGSWLITVCEETRSR